MAAGLVRTPAKWPGAKVLADDVGRRVIKVKRPDYYFNLVDRIQACLTGEADEETEA